MRSRGNTGEGRGIKIMPYETEKPAPNPYSLLDEIQKEVEVLRVRLIEATNKYLKLAEAIETHYREIKKERE